jgi:hypothetical protein
MENNPLINILYFSKNNKFLKNIIDVYNSISSDICQKEGKIVLHSNIEFNNYIGDITKNIYWTWVTNQNAKKIFNNFFEDIELVYNLNILYNNNFSILGVSYITLDTDEILDKDSVFHHDILSYYDDINETNILTVLLPIIFEENMGGLEYITDDTKQTYRYQLGEVIVFDSSKVKHRTLPFKIESKKKRVLLSVNLSSDKQWAISATKTITQSQGNLN